MVYTEDPKGFPCNLFEAQVYAIEPHGRFINGGPVIRDHIAPWGAFGGSSGVLVWGFTYVGLLKGFLNIRCYLLVVRRE